MNISLDLYSPVEIRAFAAFLTTVADAVDAAVKEKEAAYGAQIGNHPDRYATEGVLQKAELVVDEKAFLSETTGTPTRKRGEPSPGHKRRTKAEIAEDEAVSVASGSVADIAQPAISTGEERVAPDDEPEVEQQDAADEAAETAKAGADLTHDDVRGAMGRYVEKFGMDAAQVDLPKLFALALKDQAITKVSLIPNDQKSLKIVVDGVNEMLAKNPFGRDEVA